MSSRGLVKDSSVCPFHNRILKGVELHGSSEKYLTIGSNIEQNRQPEVPDSLRSSRLRRNCSPSGLIWSCRKGKSDFRPVVDKFCKLSPDANPPSHRNHTRSVYLLLHLRRNNYSQMETTCQKFSYALQCHSLFVEKERGNNHY